MSEVRGSSVRDTGDQGSAVRHIRSGPIAESAERKESRFFLAIADGGRKSPYLGQ